MAKEAPDKRAEADWMRDTLWPRQFYRGYDFCVNHDDALLEEMKQWLQNKLDDWNSRPVKSGIEPTLLDVAAIALLDIYDFTKANARVRTAELDAHGIEGDLTTLDTEWNHIKSVRRQGGKIMGKTQTRAQQPKWDRWQAWADEKWQKNPRLSKSEVARLIVSEHHIEEKATSVAKRIRKLAP